MPFISVCKQVIAQNNKHDWKNPKPTIRVSNTPSGKVTKRAHRVAILDRNGDEVARMVATTDGKPVISCGAKVALITTYDVRVLDEE